MMMISSRKGSDFCDFDAWNQTKQKLKEYKMRRRQDNDLIYTSIILQDNSALTIKDQDDKKLNLFIERVTCSLSAPTFSLLKIAG